MKKNRNTLFAPIILFAAIIIVVSISSCEKDISVDLPQPENQYVVEGYIEPGQIPYVLISKSAAYFAAYDSASLLKSMVKDAVVTINNGDTTYTLTSPLVDGYFYFEPTFNLVGEVGKTYTLRIITPDGTELTSTTTIPTPIALDSTWFKIQEGFDSLGYVWARMTDPDTLGNCYRWFAKRLSKDEQYIAPLGSTFEDKFINGKSFDFAYNRGEVPNSTAEDDENEEEGFFKDGDTVVVKFCAVTKESYDFWRLSETQASNNGNPFGSITPIKGNINGGIGIWEAITPSYDTVICKK